MNPFHEHVWSPYHCTEICYFNRQKSHIRMFEACQTCKARRQVDLLPDEVEDHINNLEAS